MAKIIIVEDDYNVANIYKNKLTEKGHDVKIVGDVAAVNEISQEKPDLVLLDILMPNVSGLSILRELRDNPEFENLPIIILTNVEKSNEIEQAVKLGVSGYLLKSEIDLESLSRRVEEFLAQSKNKGAV